jgi:hypothetical protein
MSYDEICSILEAQVEEARQGHQTSVLQKAIERFQQFAENGLIPEDFVQDETSPY